MATLIWLDSLDSPSFRPNDIGLSSLVESFRANGFDLEKPIIVALDCFTVLSGHRRVAALRWLAANEPTTLRKVLPSGKVPCVIDTTRVAS